MSSEIFMVDISEKPDVVRMAKAEGKIRLKKETIRTIKEERIKKGDVISAAKLAAINAVKKTSDMIFLTHPIPITDVDVSFEINEDESTIKLAVRVKSFGKTGVEIEALMGVMTGLLTIFDMCKYLEKDKLGQYHMTDISDIRVVEKTKKPPTSD
jgi:cyclic pyranopterin phosphate synthase